MIKDLNIDRVQECYKLFIEYCIDKDFKKAIMLVKEYSDILNYTLSLAKQKDGVFDYQYALKLYYTATPECLIGLNETIFEQLRIEAIKKKFFKKNIYNKFLKNKDIIKINTNYKYNFQDCLNLLDNYVFSCSKKKSSKISENMGIGFGFYIIANHNCPLFEQCNYKQFYDYKDLPELPNPNCPKEHGCNCYYSYK